MAVRETSLVGYLVSRGGWFLDLLIAILRISRVFLVFFVCSALRLNGAPTVLRSSTPLPSGGYRTAVPDVLNLIGQVSCQLLAPFQTRETDLSGSCGPHSSWCRRMSELADSVALTVKHNSFEVKALADSSTPMFQFIVHMIVERSHRGSMALAHGLRSGLLMCSGLSLGCRQHARSCFSSGFGQLLCFHLLSGSGG